MTTVTISAGSQFDHHGKTTVKIGSDGSLSASNVHNKETFHYETKLEEDKIKMFFSAFQSVNSARVKKRKGLPGEVLYHITISGQDKTYEMEIWDNDLDKYKEIGSALKELRQLIYRQSENKILL